MTTCGGAEGFRRRAQDAFSKAAKFRFFDMDDLRRAIEGAHMEDVDLEMHGAVVLLSARARSR